MIETVQAFIQTIKQRRHVLQLIGNIDLIIDFIAKEQKVSLSINSGKVCLLRDLNQKGVKVEIYGEQEDMKDIINGTEKLRALIKKGKVRVSAPFRTILLLESLFYLTKTDCPFAKII